MKKIVRVLQGVPSGLFRKDDEDAYVKNTKETIKALPSQLRAATLSFHKSNLCHVHKGLDDYLINEIFAWVKHEFEGAIGEYIYPIIMSGILSPYEESLIRRLEPVSEMWRPDFDLALTPPPNRRPIKAGVKWHFQANQCPACILARMGGDMDILGALFTGMVARSPNAQRSFFRPEEIRQKRLRFVKYWMKSHPCGEKEVPDKYEFGVHLKTLRTQAKKLIGDRDKKFFYQRHSIMPSVETVRYPSTGASSSRGSRDRYPEERFTSQQSGQYLNTPSPRNGSSAPSRTSSIAKSSSQMASRLSQPVDLPAFVYTGDFPTYSALSPLMPTESFRHAAESGPAAGLQRAPRTQRSGFGRDPTVSRFQEHLDTPSASPYPAPESRPAADLQRAPRIQRSGPGRISRFHEHLDSPPVTPPPAPSSVYSTASRLSSNTTIASYDRAPPSVSDMYTPARPSPLDRYLNSRPVPTPLSPGGITVWASEANTALAEVPSGRAQEQDLPMPRPQSMYGSFCDAAFDGTEFDYADESPPASPVATAADAMSAQFDRAAAGAVAESLAALTLEQGKGVAGRMETLREEAPARQDEVPRKEVLRKDAPRTQAPRKVTRRKEPAPHGPWNKYF
jgi:hypothetical protein